MNTEIERKYLIEMPDDALLMEQPGAEKSAIVQTYLTSPEGVTERVRRRDYGDRVVCFHTIKKRLSAMSAFEDESVIDEAEYESLLTRADKNKTPIIKTRYAIPYAEHVAEIDVYPFWKYQAVLEIELESEDTVVPFPPYLTLIREVTGDHAYSNNKLSVKIPEEDIFAFTKELSTFSGRPVYDGNGDFFVSVNGCDENDGSRDHPFATLERAIKAVKGKSATVCVGSGIYRVRDLTFDSSVSGSEDAPVIFRPLGDGEVILSASEKLDPADFSTIDGKIFTCTLDAERFPDAGQLYPVGSHGSWDKYDSYVRGVNRELFVNGKRMQLSRYPKEGFLTLADVVDPGDCLEYPVHSFHLDWHSRRNHRSGEYVMDADTALRVQNWKHKDDVWVFGYFGYDWASASCPVKEFGEASFIPAYVSKYGAYKGARYCFMNAADELAPGEWYIDRKTSTLYLYPENGLEGADIEFSGKESSVVNINGARFLTIEGFTVEGARGTAITAQGEHITLRDLIVRKSGGYGVQISGKDNLVSGCELYHLGEGGIDLSGGDRASLTPGGNRADNNSIHDFGLLFPSYRPGVHLTGVGNFCTHNEIYDCPHSAIIYGGNDLIIEYNVVHDAVKSSTDAGAIYAGRDWTKRGCSVSFNCVYRVGSNGNYPDGIYFDDLISGQTAHHNLLVDVGKYGFIVGGGRDISIYNNIVAACGRSCIDFDSRGRDAYLFDGWAKELVCGDDAFLWKNLREMPWESEVWLDHYPELRGFTVDDKKPDDPAFAVNPAGGKVTNNLFIAPVGLHTRVFPDVFCYSDVSGNNLAVHQKDVGLAYGLFRFFDNKSADGFEPLQLSTMGRY